MLEGILYLGLASSVIGFSASFIMQEQRRQEEILVAREFSLVMQGAQNFVSARYEQILAQLYQEALDGGGEAVRSYSVSDLSNEGFLPVSFLDGGGALDRLYGQEFRLLTRAVLISDSNLPRGNLTVSDLDPSPGQGSIIESLIDGDPSNDEVQIEAILVSAGGVRIPTQRGAPITTRTERSNAGFIESGTEARGPYGVFSFDVSGFSGVSGYPTETEGRFAAVVALAGFGVLDASGMSTTLPPELDLGDAFRRCADILSDGALDQNSPLYVECRDTTNAIYGDIVLVSYDSNNDGVINVFPSIIGPSRISMSPDTISAIENLRVIGCGTVAPGTGSDTELLIDCALTRATGNLIVEGTVLGQEFLLGTSGGVVPLAREVSLAGGPEVQVSADRFVMGDTDLSTGIYDVQILSSGDRIPKPVCPATTADGAFEMEPRIYVVPAAYSDPAGRASVGIRAFAQDGPGADEWTVRLYQYVAEDFCTFNSFSSNPINDCAFQAGNPFNPEDDPAKGNPDGLSDVSEVTGQFGRVLTMTRCF